MKKILSILLTLFISVSLFAGEKKICHNGGYLKGKYCLVTEDEINVRSGPGTSYSKVYKVHAGDIVLVKEKCKEEMFADGAYANWYEISCDKGTGYMCGRWLSSLYAENPLDNQEYIAYETIYSRPEPFDPDWGWEEEEIVSDKIIHIKDGKIDAIKGITFIPSPENPVSSYPNKIEIVDNTGLKGNPPIVVFSTDMKYGAGWFRSFRMYTLENGRLNKFFEGDSYWEGDYKYTSLVFPNKTYEGKTGTWIEKKSTYKYKIAVIKETGSTYNPGNEETVVLDFYGMEK